MESAIIFESFWKLDSHLWVVFTHYLNFYREKVYERIFSKVGYIGSRRFAHLLLYISIIMKKLLMHVPRFYTFQYVECTVYRYSLYALLVFGPTLHQSVLVYTVTPKSGNGSFLNIENLWMYYSNLKVFPGKALLLTMHDKIWCLWLQ